LDRSFCPWLNEEEEERKGQKDEGKIKRKVKEKERKKRKTAHLSENHALCNPVFP
jgi:hypothetical protein